MYNYYNKLQDVWNTTYYNICRQGLFPSNQQSSQKMHQNCIIKFLFSIRRFIMRCSQYIQNTILQLMFFLNQISDNNPLNPYSTSVWHIPIHVVFITVITANCLVPINLIPYSSPIFCSVLSVQSSTALGRMRTVGSYFLAFSGR